MMCLILRWKKQRINKEEEERKEEDILLERKGDKSDVCVSGC